MIKNEYPNTILLKHKKFNKYHEFDTYHDENGKLIGLVRGDIRHNTAVETSSVEEVKKYYHWEH